MPHLPLGPGEPLHVLVPSRAIAAAVTDQLARILAGEPLANVVDDY